MNNKTMVTKKFKGEIKRHIQLHFAGLISQPGYFIFIFKPIFGVGAPGG